MEPFQEPSGRSLRLAFVAAGLLVLLGIVAFASRSGFGHHASASPSSGYVSYAFTAFLILFVLMIPVAAYAFLLQAREAPLEQRSSFLARVLRNLAVLALLFAVGYLIIYLKHHHGLFGGLSGRFGKPHKALAHNGAGKQSPTDPTFQWTVFWVALVAVSATAAYVVFRYRRRKRRRLAALPAATTVADELIASIGIAIDDLEAEPDARRAVIAAYARMESTLGRNGLERRPSDTPLEYLRRILLDLTTRAEAVRRLTDLFELAKFSRHDIDASMKLEAIGALREIRDDLQAAPA
jgi:uncharacterized membrane protein YhaH (DUF805 family)